MNRLSQQERLMLCIVMALLLAGWALAAYRTAHPAIPVMTDSAEH